jgi:hypothetical protein
MTAIAAGLLVLGGFALQTADAVVHVELKVRRWAQAAIFGRVDLQ